MPLKISFLAPSEYGKNTAVKLLSEKYSLQNIKLAEPLYHLQEYFYHFIGKQMSGEQDGELLQYLGEKIRKENPNFILNKFKNNLLNVDNSLTIITNDDCRPPDHKALKNLGFIFIKINGFKRNRLDHTKSNPISPLEWNANIEFDYCVDNFGTLDDYRENLFNLVDYILKCEVHDE